MSDTPSVSPAPTPASTATPAPTETAFKRFQIRVAKAFHTYTGTIGAIQGKADARKADELKGKIQGS